MDPTMLPVRIRGEAPLVPKTTREDYELIKSVIAPQGTPDAQIRLAIAYAHQLGLDPLRRQVFVIKTQEGHQVVVGLHGVSTKVSLHGEYRGTSSCAVYPGEKITMHAGDGRVEHQFDPTQRTGTPVGAWSTTCRQIGNSLIPFTIYLRYEEYANPRSHSWVNQPAWMIEKTARMFSMRAAFPDVLSNIYAPEEFGERSPEGEPDALGRGTGVQQAPSLLPWEKSIDTEPTSKEEYGRCGTCQTPNILQTFKSGVIYIQCPEALRLYAATGDREILKQHHSSPYHPSTTPSQPSTTTQRSTLHS